MKYQEIPVGIKNITNGWRFKIPFIIKNVGNSPSGLLYFKLYASDPVALQNISADEDNYAYETHVMPEDLHPNVLPGNYSSTYYLDIGATVGPKSPKPGRYPSLIKVYYGQGKVAEAPVFLMIHDGSAPLSSPASPPQPVPPSPPTR